MTTYETDKQTNKDHVATPRYVVEDIYSIVNIKSYKNIWFPFNNYDSEFKLRADELKLQYKATHLFDNLRNDFFETEPPEDCDLMISNPPFSNQNNIIQRSFELIENRKVKAFALLLPISTLKTTKRGDIYQKYVNGLSVIFLKNRIKFIGHTTSFPKGCCWICYNIKSLNNKLYWI